MAISKSSGIDETIRRKYWLPNFFLKLALLFWKKRDKKIWVFGCWKGQRYDDNAKYLYEYILKEHKDIKPFWVTSNTKVYEELTRNSMPVLMSNTKEAKSILLRAGYVFFTNGLDDLSNLCFESGAICVSLGHAAGSIKKVGYIKAARNGNIRTTLKKLKNILFDWDYFDYRTCTSKESQEVTMKVYGTNDIRKMIITGLARNDILINSSKQEDTIKEIRSILYLPTYRPYNNTVVKEFVSQIISNKLFCGFLEENGYEILVKLHNMDGTSKEIISGNNCIKILDRNVVKDTQELLSHANILITDYSSCSMDFAITGRPIILYAPDFEDYDKRNGIIEYWLDLYKSEYVDKNVDQVINRIMKYINDEGEVCEINEWINNLYWDDSIRDSCFCENIYKKILDREGE